MPPLLFYTPRSLLFALCPLLFALCPLPYALCPLALCSLPFAGLFNRHPLHLHFRNWFVVPTSLRSSDVINDFLAFSHSAEDGVAWRQSVVSMHDEKLRAVCIRSRISHRYCAGLVAAFIDF